MEIEVDNKIEIDGIVIGPGMTKKQTKKLLAKVPETALFVMVTLAKMLAVQTAASSDAPAAPSGAKPVYEKTNRQADWQMCLVHLLRELKKSTSISTRAMIGCILQEAQTIDPRRNPS